MTGICTGLLTAAAISYASSTSELVLLGLKTVIVAFRIGACVWDVGERIADCIDADGRYRSWTVAVLGPSLPEVAEGLRKFAEDQVRHALCADVEPESNTLLGVAHNIHTIH